ncbi:MAG: hypothetical protein K8R09_00695, partial [Desulfobacterales bacterium]|nr:hypothetical protein [Desulfobacterales bacterium]
FSPYMIKKNLQGDGRELLLLCHLCNVANMAVIPAKAGIHSPIRSRTSISDTSVLLDSRFRGNDECLVGYFTHDTTLLSSS